ncbi:MAG: DUF2752 domain-containing protein [Lentisphaerota bacterium]
MRSTETGDQRNWRVRMLVLHGAMLAAPLALLVAHMRFQFCGLGVCLFRWVFGVDCPGCGITRSAMALLNGDVIGAFRLHPAGPLVVSLIALIVAYLVLALFTRFRGLEWRKEVQAFTGIEMLAFSALVIGWLGKGFLN